MYIADSAINPDALVLLSRFKKWHIKARGVRFPPSAGEGEGFFLPLIHEYIPQHSIKSIRTGN